MLTTPAPAFSLEGVFAGFFRDFFGKRRLVLRVDGDEVYLKIPKALRHELEGHLHAGQRVIVHGAESSEEGRRPSQRVVLQVQVEGEGTCVACPIRVCAHKHCWRGGGKELFRALEQQIAEAGLGDRVKLKAVECMDHCKKGPNVQVGACEMHRCHPGDAAQILALLTSESDPRESRKNSQRNVPVHGY